MSTHCLIGIVYPNNETRCIYCHADGYIDGGVGDLLNHYYKNKDKVEQLIDLGNLSFLGSEPISDKGQWGPNPNLGKKCRAYRDRGDKGEEYSLYDNPKEAMENQGQEFNYFFIDGEWYVKTLNSHNKPSIIRLRDNKVIE